MPTLVIFDRIVQPIGCQLLPSERAVLQVDLAAQPLHFTDKPHMPERVMFDILEESRYGSGRGQQYQSLIEGRDRSFEQLEHRNPPFPQCRSKLRRR
jgi:hypothetical protein